MQGKPRFVRPEASSEKLQELNQAYDKLIRSLFRIQNTPSTKKEKIDQILKEYRDIGEQDIEKNPIFISRLQLLSDEIKMSRPSLNQLFKNALKLLVTGGVLDIDSFKDLTGEPFVEDLAESESIPKKEKSEDEMIQYFLDELIKRRLDEKTRKVKDKKVEEILEHLKKIRFSELDARFDVRFESYGSSQNGFAIHDSDYDVSLVTLDPANERQLLNFFYEKGKEILKEVIGKEGFQFSRVTHDNIRIPLVKLHIVKDNLHLSFSVNNTLGVHNTNLIRTYSQFDNRCYKLGLLVKIWARVHKVVSAQKHYLSSYGFMLLVIYFLQSLREPILPRIQKQDPDNKKERTAQIKICRKVANGKLEEFEADIHYEKDPKVLEEMKSEYQCKLSEIKLLKKFFKYYMQKENFEGLRLSVKVDDPCMRNGGEENEYLYSIEDPFDSRHNPGKHLKKNSPQARDLLNAMKISYTLLKANKYKEVFQPFL